MTTGKLVSEPPSSSFCASVTQPTDLISNPDAVILNLAAKSGGEAIRELHGLVGLASGAVSDPPQFLADLIERAGVASVCIAGDIALPHARTAAVSRMVLAVGRSEHGIVFDAEHPEVRLVFLIGTPKDAVTDYLKLVAALSRMLKDAALRQGLMTAKTEMDFLKLLTRAGSAKR